MNILLQIFLIRYSNVLLQVKVVELVLGRKQKLLKKRIKIQWWGWLEEEETF